jgi:predicted aconitase with swiveling domain
MSETETGATLDKPRLVIRGRGIVPGVAEGEALVTRDTISGWGGISPLTGTIIESRHELVGQSFANKVLVFPGAKGSSGWSGAFHAARLKGVAPRAMIFNIMTTKAALGAVVMRIPTVTECDTDPLDAIKTGNWVRVDGDQGVIMLWDKRPE